MASFSSLSAKQLKILTFIGQEISHSGRPPSLRDIAKHFGYESIGTVQDHLRALIKKGYLKKEEGISRGIQLVHRSSSRHIPILGIVPAGSPIEALETSLGTLPIAIPESGREVGEYYALRVRGESMKDKGILDNDYVIVKKQSHAENGDIVIAMLDGEATVKILEKKRGRIRLLPANPLFSPIDLSHPNSQTEPPHLEIKNIIQGKVVGVQRYYSPKN